VHGPLFRAAGQPKPTWPLRPTPDFPLIYAEKGAFTAHATRACEGDGPITIERFRAGLRVNMVTGRGEATLRASDPAALRAAAERLAAAPYVRLEEVADGNGETSLRVRAIGRAAHASTPDEGANAAFACCTPFMPCPAWPEADRGWDERSACPAPTDGSGIGIARARRCVRTAYLQPGPLSPRKTGRLRRPSTCALRHQSGDDLRGRVKEALAPAGWRATFAGQMEPLYVPQDEEPVKTLLRVYREHTGDPRPPTTMGGRTYATSVAPRGVAFGPGLPGDPEVAHQPDEFIGVERLILCAKIYAHALYELAK
jgi:succinyl-diaminopimelate desuccinylase